MLRIGDSVERFEDARLLCGRGRFVDDLPAPGQAHLVLLRSSHAHARIRAIQSDAAATMAGVLAVVTGSDLESFGMFSNRIRRSGVDGKPMFEPPRRVLALGTVRYVGEPVAAVVAEDSALARDALEKIVVDYEPLPAIDCIETAIAPDARAVWPEVPGNVAFVFDAGDPTETQRAFASARHVVRLDVRVNRVSAQPIEPRAALAFYDPDEARFTLYASNQTPHGLRDELSRIVRVPANRLQVVAPDVGGAFGMKSNDYSEYALVLWAARRTGRPVRWTGDRSESFVGDHHARDNLWQLALAMDDQHRFLAVQAQSYANLGAYLAYAGTHQATNNVGSLAGVYATQHLHVRVRGVYTNTSSVSPYRGAGRPEALYAMERLIDRAAEQTGIDRMELRRRNL
ncbi:MAG: xanthine dehydrogenase family protein molybdopterin-binding subunit, partial [Actinobacteria bacterium]|nr:xanthine dehydrogenase family protein molybdopterin-binding subunit [Actinomycetota bacterium]